MISKKLSKIGKSSTMLILPKSWLDHTNLHPGDTVFINPQETDLIISSEYAPKTDRTTIAMKEFDKSELEREIIGAYIAGYDEILIKTSEISRYSATITKVTRFLSGAEVLSETGDETLIKCILQPTEVSISGIIKRMKYLVDQMLGASKDTIMTEGEENIRAMEDNVDRLFFLGTRFLNKALYDPTFISKLGIRRGDIVANQKTIENLEKIADYSMKIKRELDNVKKKNAQRACQMLEDSRKLLDVALESFLDRDKNKAHEVFSIYEGFHKKRDFAINELSAEERGSPSGVIVFYYCSRVGHIALNIAETTFDLR